MCVCEGMYMYVHFNQRPKDEAGSPKVGVKVVCETLDVNVSYQLPFSFRALSQ